MKIKIDTDELYPVYMIYDNWGDECEVPEETVARWLRVEKEFAEMQQEMRNAIENSKAQ